MKKAAFAVAAVILVAAAVLFIGLPMAEKQAALQLHTELERSGEVKVGAVEVGLLGRRIVLSNLASADPPGAEVEFSVGHLDVQGLAWPLGELLRGRTPFDGFRLGDPLQAGHLEARDLRLTDRAAMTEWRAGSITADDIDLARFDAGVVGGDSAMTVTARALAALSVGRLEQRDTSLTSTAGGPPVGLGSIVFERFDRGLIGNLALADMKVGASRTPSAAFDVHEISAAGLDLRKQLAAAASGTLRSGQPIGRVWADRFVIAGVGGPALKPYGFSLERLTHEQKRESDSAIVSRTRIDGLVLNPVPGAAGAAELRMSLDAIGVGELKLSLDCGAREDRGAGVLKIENCALTSPDLAELVFGMTVVGIDERLWRAIDGGDIAHFAVGKAALGAAQLVISDKSLLDRILKAAAKSTGTPVMLLRPVVALQIRKYQPPGVLITADMTKLLDTVARFVEQGGTLTLTAHPDPPFAFSRADLLLTPGPDLVSAFGLSATQSK